MTTMIERVARAIHGSAVCQPATGPWQDDIMTASQKCCIAAARAAIEAMRHQTEAMAWTDGWQEKINAALEEK